MLIVVTGYSGDVTVRGLLYSFSGSRRLVQEWSQIRKSSEELQFSLTGVPDSVSITGVTVSNPDAPSKDDTVWIARADDFVWSLKTPDAKAVFRINPAMAIELDMDLSIGLIIRGNVWPCFPYTDADCEQARAVPVTVVVTAIFMLIIFILGIFVVWRLYRQE